MRPFREGWWQSRRQRAPRRRSRDPMGPHEGPEPQDFHIHLAVDVPQSVSSHTSMALGHTAGVTGLRFTWGTRTDGGVGQRRGVTGANRSHQRSEGIVFLGLPNTGRACPHVLPLFPEAAGAQAPPCEPQVLEGRDRILFFLSFIHSFIHSFLVASALRTLPGT